MKMSIIFTNVRSVINKQGDLWSVVDLSNASTIVVLTETWLTSRICDSEILPYHRNFNIYRQDRDVKTGDDVLIAIADHISSFLVNIVTELEIVQVCICVNHCKYLLGVCYRPPSKNGSFVSSFPMSSTVTVCFPNVPIILLGDFNYPNVIWSDDVHRLHQSENCH